MALTDSIGVPRTWENKSSNAIYCVTESIRGFLSCVELTEMLLYSDISIITVIGYFCYCLLPLCQNESGSQVLKAECRSIPSIDPWLTLQGHLDGHSIGSLLIVSIVLTDSYVSINTRWSVCKNYWTLDWLSTEIMCWLSSGGNVDHGYLDSPCLIMNYVSKYWLIK